MLWLYQTKSDDHSRPSSSALPGKYPSIAPLQLLAPAFPLPCIIKVGLHKDPRNHPLLRQPSSLPFLIAAIGRGVDAFYDTVSPSSLVAPRW